MYTRNNHRPAPINTLLWAALIGLLIQVALVFILQPIGVTNSTSTESMGPHLFNILNF